MTTENPYRPPAEVNFNDSSTVDKKPRVRLRYCVLYTAVVALLSSIPLAGLIGLLFRFPVPFAGYVTGLAAIPSAMVGAFMYGIIGGFVVQGCMGSAGGIAVFYAARLQPSAVRYLIGGILSALPGLLLLAMLDWIIGPW